MSAAALKRMPQDVLDEALDSMDAAARRPAAPAAPPAGVAHGDGGRVMPPSAPRRSSRLHAVRRGHPGRRRSTPAVRARPTAGCCWSATTRPTPETTRRWTRCPASTRLRGRFDEVLSWNETIAPVPPRRLVPARRTTSRCGSGICGCCGTSATTASSWSWSPSRSTPRSGRRPDLHRRARRRLRRRADELRPHPQQARPAGRHAGAAAAPPGPGAGPEAAAADRVRGAGRRWCRPTPS